MCLFVGLQPPCDDLLVDPELWGDLISLEQNACIEVGDYRRAMRRVDGMLQYSPIVTYIRPYLSCASLHSHACC